MIKSRAHDFSFLIGQRNGKLEIIADAGVINERHFLSCKCDCGRVYNIRKDKWGRDQTCGCYAKELAKKLKYIPFDSIQGKKDFHLTYLRDLGNRLVGYKMERYMLCLCDCGNYCEIKVRQRKAIKTCGCGIFRKGVENHRYIDGRTKERLYYSIWMGMFRRCYNPKARSYENYGGRGIIICNEWFDYPVFRKWAVENGYKHDLSIERKNNNIGYNAANCEWIALSQQTANKRDTIYLEYKGVIKRFAEWIIIIGEGEKKVRSKISRRIKLKQNEIFLGYEEVLDNYINSYAN